MDGVGGVAMSNDQGGYDEDQGIETGAGSYRWKTWHRKAKVEDQMAKSEVLGSSGANGVTSFMDVWVTRPVLLEGGVVRARRSARCSRVSSRVTHHVVRLRYRCASRGTTRSSPLSRRVGIVLLLRIDPIRACEGFRFLFQIDCPIVPHVAHVAVHDGCVVN